MTTSEQIESYCNVIRKKFSTNRKMSYPRRVKHTREMVYYLNTNHSRQLDPVYVLKVLCLDYDRGIYEFEEEEEYEY
jgi:hypothetical protein